MSQWISGPPMIIAIYPVVMMALKIYVQGILLECYGAQTKELLMSNSIWQKNYFLLLLNPVLTCFARTSAGNVPYKSQEPVCAGTVPNMMNSLWWNQVGCPGNYVDITYTSWDCYFLFGFCHVPVSSRQNQFEVDLRWGIS